MSGITIFIQRQPGKKSVNEIRQDAVNPVKQGKDGPEGDGDRCQDDQSLQKVFEQFTGNDLEFHNQWFGYQK